MSDDAIFAGSIWAATAPAAPDTTQLKGDLQCDVVVIGAGFTGLSCALHLAQAGVKVIVLEANVIGHGASGRNNGQVIPTFSRVEPDAVPSMISAEAGGARVGEALVKLVADSARFTFDLIRKHQIDCEAVQNGWVQPAHSPGRMPLLEKRVRAWSRYGAPAELLDARGVQTVTGSSFWFGGWENPTGGKLNPLAYARGLARTAIRLGAQVFTQSPVLAVTRQGLTWQANTSNGSVRASRVVLATHAYTDRFTDTLWPRLMQSVIPVRSYQMATQVYSDDVRAQVLPEDHACSDTQGDLHFFRWDNHNRLVTGGGLAIPLGWRTRITERIAERVQKVFPQLGRPQFSHVWHGNVGVTPDRLPHCHEPAPGVFAFVGCNGRGVALSGAIGQELARACTGTPISDLAVPFTPLTPIFGHAIGRRVASLALLTYRRRDAREPASA